MSDLPIAPCMQSLASGSPEKVLETLLWPCPTDEFATTIRQQGALLIERECCRSMYSGIFSSKELWKLLKERDLQYSINVDVTLFTAEKRRQDFNHNCMEENIGRRLNDDLAGGQRKGGKKRCGAENGDRHASEV
jgi:hypothetical protein